MFCTWHRLMVMVLKPAEEAVNCGEYLRTVTKTIWSDGHILHPTEKNKHVKGTQTSEALAIELWK